MAEAHATSTGARRRTRCARGCATTSASPLGTLMNTLELMAEDPASIAEALPIANEAAQGLAGRVRLLRAAWAGDCGPMDAAGLAALAAGLPPRVTAELGGLRPGEHAGPAARVLLNLLLLGAEALPRGGVVSLSGQPGGDVLVTVQGAAAAWPPGLWAALADPLAGAGPGPGAVAVEPRDRAAVARGPAGPRRRAAAVGADARRQRRVRWRRRCCWRRVNPIFGTAAHGGRIRRRSLGGWTSC